MAKGGVTESGGGGKDGFSVLLLVTRLVQRKNLVSALNLQCHNVCHVV